MFCILSAYRMSKISVYEDRPVAKTLGFVGVAIMSGFFLFIVILDCVRVGQSNKKKDGK